MKIAEVLAVTGSETDRLIKFLDSQPSDEVFPMSQIREILQGSFSSGRFAAQKHRWKDYTTRVILEGRVVSVWGSKDAISNLKRQNEDGVPNEN